MRLLKAGPTRSTSSRRESRNPRNVERTLPHWSDIGEWLKEVIGTTKSDKKIETEKGIYYSS